MTTRDLAYYVDGLVEGRRGTLVQEKRDLRWVWRVEEGGRVWFAKRAVTTKRHLELRREAENALALQDAGMGAEVLAWGRRDGAQWLVTADAGHSFSWEIFRTDVPRNRLFSDLAHLVRALHGRGWAFRDLTEEHVRVRRGVLVLIDAARMTRGRRSLGAAARAPDLAALLFSFGPPWLSDWLPSRVERVRLLRDACGFNGEELRGLCRDVDDRMETLAGRTRWRHEYFDDVDGVIEALWGAGGGTTDRVPPFQALMRRAGTHVLRTLPDRENRVVRAENGKPLFFMKVFPPTKKGWSPAMRELAAIDLFQRAGILVNRVAAYAEDADKGSMVAVAAARGEPLDDLMRRGVSVAERRALAVQTARIWRRMRECGLRHRDAYPCHLFAAPWGSEPLRFELRLIDLTRAGNAPFPKERWFVKDAAALWHGLPKPPVTRTDAVRWLREYFRVAKLDARAKRFARRVAAKERRIAARQERKSRR